MNVQEIIPDRKAVIKKKNNTGLISERVWKNKNIQNWQGKD